MSSRSKRPRRGYPPGATALRPRRGISLFELSREDLSPGRGHPRNESSGSCEHCHDLLCLPRSPPPSRASELGPKRSQAAPSDLSRILLPPASILAVTRVHAVSLGRSGADRAETCLMGTRIARLARCAGPCDNESCDPPRLMRRAETATLDRAGSECPGRAQPQEGPRSPGGSVRRAR